MYRADFTNLFGDLRLERRGLQLLSRLFSQGSRSIQQLALSRAEQKSFYRLLRNEKVQEDKLIEELRHRCGKAVKGKLVLAIQDTTEINLFRHRNRLDQSTGIGRIGTHECNQIGFKLHPSMVIDACSGLPLGFADIYMWNRPMGKETKYDRKYQELPIEEKESYRWVETSKRTKECLKEADKVIIIQDREGDIFEQIEQVPDKRTYLLVRSRGDRRLSNGGKLWNTLKKAPLAGTYSFFIDSDSHSKEPSRNAEIEVRFAKVKIAPPINNKKSNAQTIYAVEAREINSSAGEPVLWRLITTWPVKDFETAQLLIAWYSCRWVIEEVFRLLKKEGFNIEGSELESGWAIRKLSIMILDTILKLLQMYIAYNIPEGESPDIDISFTDEEQVCLKAVNVKHEGKTTALQNPYKPTTLKWAAWVIARAGGWKGYKSQRPPGMTTMLNGLRKFYIVFDGWMLQKDVGTR